MEDFSDIVNILQSRQESQPRRYDTLAASIVGETQRVESDKIKAVEREREEAHNHLMQVINSFDN